MLLLGHGADIHMRRKSDDTILLMAVYKGYTDIVTLLLDKGLSPQEENSDTVSPLRLAAYRGHKDIVALLLERGAVIDSRDKNGYTALMHAALRDHGDVMILLLERNADPGIKDKEGKTAFSLVEDNGYLETAALLHAYLEKKKELQRQAEQKRRDLAGADLFENRLTKLKLQSRKPVMIRKPS